MGTLSVDTIVKKVRVKLDEIELNESEMMGSDTDNANLDEIIKSCIPEAFRSVAMLADPSMLEGTDGSGLTLTIDSGMVGHVELPDSVLRVLNVRLSSWIAACSDLVDENSQEYKMQSNRWACGNPNRPVAALVHTSAGRELELYKAASVSDTLKSFNYVAAVTDTDTSIKVSEQTSDAFIYFVAGLTMTSLREDVAEDFFKVGRSLLGLE